MELNTIRDELNVIDDELTALFEKRFELSSQAAQTKATQGLPILNTAREREIISRVTKNQDDVLAGYTKILFETIFDLSRTHQTVLMNKTSRVNTAIREALQNTPQLFPKSAVVACQGTEGANSTLACDKLFDRPSIMYFNSFDGVFGAVEKGLCAYGVLPIENSLHGSVTGVYDLMKKYNFYIVRGIKLKVNHALLAKRGVKQSDIKVIYSHEQAIAQCSEFLKGLNVQVDPCENTATAAKMVAESARDDVASLSTVNCAELYNLDVINDKVQNSDNNYTKFICISKKLEIYPGARRISLMMTVPHRPGALYHLMTKFSAIGINLTKLESRPLPDKDFEFTFYFDLDVSVYDEAVFNLFAQLESGTETFEFLGCYSEV